MSGFDFLLFVPMGAVLALGFAGFLVFNILRFDQGTDRMREIASAVRVGARAYLKRQNSIVAIFFILVFLILKIIITSYFLQEGDHCWQKIIFCSWFNII